MMTLNERRLIRLLVRFQNHCDRISADASDTYDRDSAFDGGEFCGPAIVLQAQRDMDAVAQRLGFANADVAQQVSACILFTRPTSSPE